jgi:hypothetical protein
MTATQTRFGERESTQETWQWMREMIEDVESDQERDAFVRSLFQWDFAVAQFRKVEQKKVILQEPTELDLRFHAMCLNALIARGHALVLASRAFTEDQLAAFKIHREDITSYVEELERSFREWHHGFADAEIRKASESIFGAAA